MSEFGLVASGKRSIRDGSNYEHLFPHADGKDTIIKRDGNVKDTIDKMVLIVSRTLKDTEKIAPALKGRTLKETCEKTWTFLYNHVQYELDEKGLEQLRRPARSWQDRKTGIDCDCFSIFTSSILTNLGINHELRITKYSDNWQHVYVIVPSEQSHRGYYIIDCVVDRFNYEKPYSEKKDFNIKKLAEMNGIPISYLSGVNENSTDNFFGVIFGVDFQQISMDGLGAVPFVDKVADAMYKHILRTRQELATNPDAVKKVTDPQAYMKMLDYAVEHWNTPQRDTALSILEDQENKMLKAASLQGFGHLMGYGLGGFWSSIKSGLSKAKAFVVRNVQSAAKDIKQVAQQVAKAVIRFNPLTAAARAAILKAMKSNTAGIAARLKWGYATLEQAVKKGISAADWQKYKNAIKKIEDYFGFNTAASASNLKNSILGGSGGGITGIGSLGEAGAIEIIINKIFEWIGVGKKDAAPDSSPDGSRSLVTDNGGSLMPSSAYQYPSGAPTPPSSSVMEWVKANPGKTAIGVVAIGTTLALVISKKARHAVGIGNTPPRKRRKHKPALSGTPHKPKKRVTKKHKTIRLK